MLPTQRKGDQRANQLVSRDGVGGAISTSSTPAVVTLSRRVSGLPRTLTVASRAWRKPTAAAHASPAVAHSPPQITHSSVVVARRTLFLFFDVDPLVVLESSRLKKQKQQIDLKKCFQPLKPTDELGERAARHARADLVEFQVTAKQEVDHGISYLLHVMHIFHSGLLTLRELVTTQEILTDA